MKAIFIILSAFFALNTGGIFYNVPVTLADGSPMQLSECLDKKVIIATFDAFAPDTIRLQTLDSLQSANGDSVIVLAIPSKDFSDSIYSRSADSLIQSLALTLHVTQPMYVKKGSRQDSLPRWLTHVTENTHFDYDIDSPNKLFVVNEHGILYAIESDSLSVAYVNAVLHRDVIY